MKFTYSWLKDHINIQPKLKQIEEHLTSLGLEVESISSKYKEFDKMIVCEIKSVNKHPNADRLKICEVSNGQSSYKVVCGADNATVGLRTIFASNGTYIPGKDFVLEKKSIRGIEGDGMLCSSEELGIFGNTNGIIELNNKYILGTSLSNYVEEDYIFEIGLTPNRGDCASVRGIARDLAAKSKLKLIEKKINNAKGTYHSNIVWKLNKLKKNSDCPLVLGRHFKIEANNESPPWLKEKLTDIGLTPISALVDITNYILYDLGRPLHVFDAEKISGDLFIRRAFKGEEFFGLDSKKYNLCEDDIVIADEKKILSLAGIIGGMNSCVDDKTKNVFLEVAYFNPITISNTARKYNINTDAAYRFERGIDKEGLNEGLETASKLIHDLCGGSFSKIIVSDNKIEKNKSIKYSFAKFTKVMGYEVSKEIQIKILNSLSFDLKNCSENNCQVTPPSWRHDILNNNDIIEEIARLNGYENIPYKNIKSELGIEKKISNINNLRINYREVLANLGLYEVVTYTFISDQKYYPKKGLKDELILANPISSELNVMRNSLFPNLLDICNKNFSKSFETNSLFEIGYVFEGIKEEEQKLHLALVLSGIKRYKSWKYETEQFDFYDVKSRLMHLLKIKNINDDIRLDRSKEVWYHPGKSADVYVKNVKIGSLGEIHPNILKAFSIKQKTVLGNICLSTLSRIEKTENKKTGLSMSPFLTLKKDFAFLLPKDKTVGELISVVKSVDPIIGNIRIFDIYEDKKLEDEKLSVGLEVEIKQIEKVLNAKEINEYMTKIINKVEFKLGVSLRK